jgi:amino acid adenylation domain-containing protein
MHVTVHEQPSFPLNFTVFRGEQLVVRILYDRRRFEQSAIDRLVASFVVTLERLAVDAHSRLGSIDVLPASERRKIVETWNDTDRVFPDTLKIHQLFEQQVEHQPDAIAVEMDGQTLSYRELEERANRLAHALRFRGAGTGKYVGICLDRGLNLVVAMLGVAKSGSPYVPLDPNYPAERLTFMVKETEAIAVVTEKRFETLFASPVLLLDEGEDGELERFSVSRPRPIGSSSDVCYTIFTSGSTGTPKGVVLCHKAVVNTLDWVSRNYRVGPGDRLFFVTSPCFDLSVYDTFGALGAGATVVVASSAMLSEPNALAKAITEQRITIWDSAPASLQRLVPFLPSIASNQSMLRLVMLSGDWIPLALPDSVTSAFPSAEVKSLGGATEAAIWSNHFSIGAIDPRWTSIPYGRPIQNARYHVLDADLRPLPVGGAGDLYISGVCLAEGYLKQPELTAERFLPNHLSPHPGERLYKTGDRARYMEDGNLEFLGRMDSQIKIRGFRVEIGEVESVIATLPGIREAICIAHTDASGSKSLIAYVVAVSNVVLRPEFVIDALAQRLPGFMVPSQVFVLQAMPLSSNGKIDRNALPNPSTSASRTSFIAPRNYTEDAIASIYAELLKLESVSVTDDFFALGGHSLLAVILITTVKNNLGVELPFSALLEHPTVEAMAAAVIKMASSIKHTTHLVALNRNGTLPPIILMPGMGGYAYTFKPLADQLAPNQPVWALQLINGDIESEQEEISVEAMADIYLDQILAAFPDGPIILGGYSFGALPAFELAHRLIKLGREVPYFISFDGFAPGYPKRLVGLRWIHAHILEFVRTENRKAHLRGRFVNIFLRARRLFGIPDPVEANPAFKDPAINDHFNKLRIITRRALQRYKPTHKLSVPLLLFRPEIPFQWMATDLTCPAHGWHRFMEDSITVVTLPGDHLTLFSTGNLMALANTIKHLEIDTVVGAQVT